MLGYALATVVAGTATCAVLHHEHGRHPFGDSRAKAFRWWCALVALDIVVADLYLTGAYTLASLHQVQGATGAVRGVLAGLLVPLAIRSPVREVRIGGKRERVGFTYFYDRVRIHANRRLDEFITRLRRADRQSLESDLSTRGWDPATFLSRLCEWVRDLKKLDGEDRDEIMASVAVVLTSPAQQRFRGLILIALENHLDGLFDELKQSPPTPEDAREGRRIMAALKKRDP